MPTAFPILSIVMIVVLLLFFTIRSSNKKIQEADDDFWDKELKANSTPAKDISNLPYITIPMEKFPLKYSSSDEVLAIESRLEDLSHKKLLNLTNKTNTDLKLEYGRPNLDTMQEIGDNFDQLTTCLIDYANAMIELENYTGAIAILEYGAAIKSDIASNYTLLADCYIKIDKANRIKPLYDQVKSLELINQASILRHFDQLLGEEAN